MSVEGGDVLGNWRSNLAVEGFLGKTALVENEPFLVNVAMLWVKLAFIRGWYYSGKNRICLEENEW
jgi:hypothetical protein